LCARVTGQWPGFPELPKLDAGPQFEVVLDCIKTAKTGAVRNILAGLFKESNPNLNHRVLARLGHAGCWLVTTNFDRNVEQAIEDLQYKVRPLRSSQELRNFDDRGKRIPVLKLHGCISSPGTIISTMRDLERRGSSSASSLLSPDRQRVLRVFLKRPICFLLGYSGSDTLDIMPTLQQIRKCRLVLVKHTKDKSVNPEEIRIQIEKGRQQVLSLMRGDRYHDILYGDTTRFLTDLSNMLHLELPAGPEVQPGTENKTEVISKHLQTLRADEALIAIWLIVRATADTALISRFKKELQSRGLMALLGIKQPSRPWNEYELRARQYISNPRPPIALAGGGLRFPAAKQLAGEKPRRESEIQVRQLTAITRIRFCIVVGKQLTKYREVTKARHMFEHAERLAKILGRTKEMLTAQSRLKRLGKNTQRKFSATQPVPL
jgi:hypothetical protein